MAAAEPPRSRWSLKAPGFIATLYAQLPLVVLDQDDSLDWTSIPHSQLKHADSSPVLWIAPPQTSSHPHSRPWASASPESLRAQLLFLLRDPSPSISFRPWSREASAPKGKLPALHLTTSNKILASDEIRPWLETNHSLKGKSKEFHGMTDQAMYDKAVAVGQLVTEQLLPAFLVSLPRTSSQYHLRFSVPPPLSAGLKTPLPASVTGDKREIDNQNVLFKGQDALEALVVLVGSGWALGARAPTPLDALIASHLYCIYSLPESSVLKQQLHASVELDQYVERVLSEADRHL